jgi:glycosidase
MAGMAPPWLSDAIIYEVNVRTFSPQGNFAGVEAALGRLAELGVNVLWLMPIHPIGRVRRKGRLGSPYSIRDYYAINPDYGTHQDLRSLIREAHRRGLRVLMDVVANHTAWDSVMLEHPDFYRHDAAGRVIAPNPGWDDVAALNYENPRLRTYMTSMLEYWVREFDVDGFRCDVAFLVPTDFWKEARISLEKLKPDVLMLAEADKPDLLNRAFDLDYSWPLYRTLKAVMSGGAPASALRATWEEQQKLFPEHALHMRFSDNHDEERAIALFGAKGALAASLLMFMLDGVPLLYNGMEVGDSTESGGDALFEKLDVFWDIASRRQQFAQFYQKLIPLRKSSAALKTGELTWIDTDAPASIVSFHRSSPVEEALVAINLTNRPVDAMLRSGIEGSWTSAFGNATPSPRLSLAAWDYAVWIRKR